MTLPIAPSAAQLTAEQRAAALVTRDLRRQLEAASRAITALYVKVAGGVGNEIPLHLRRAFADGASDIIARVHIDIQDELWVLVQAALEAGQQSAAAALALTAGEDQDPLVQLLSPLAEWIQQLSGTAQQRAQAVLTSAQAAPTVGAPPANYRDVVALIGQLHQTVTLLERDTRWATNAAYNQAFTVAAAQAGVDRYWVAERDACLHCLAYSGQVAHARAPYPPGLTFYIDPRGLPKPVNRGVVWGPPLHPNCRCNQEIWLPGETGYPVYPWESGEVTPPQALQREARRSVLRGQSGSDSRPARLRAISALLAIGSGLPKTVEKRARAAVKAGQFRERVG